MYSRSPNIRGSPSGTYSQRVLERYEGPSLSEERKRELAERKNDTYRRLLANMSPSDLTEEVRTTLEALRSSGLKLGIATGLPSASVRQALL